jgi:hypothetical protein
MSNPYEPVKSVRLPIKYSQKPPSEGPLISAISGTRGKKYDRIGWAPNKDLARSESGITDWTPDQKVEDLLKSPNASNMFLSTRDKFTPEQLQMTITEFRDFIKNKHGKNTMIPRADTINSVTIGGIDYPYIIDDEMWSTTQEKEKAIKDMANEAGFGKWSIDNVSDHDGNIFTKVCDFATSSCFLIAAGTVLAGAAAAALVKSGHIGGKNKTIKSKRKIHKKSKSHKKTKHHKNKNQSRKRRRTQKKH